jgi:hypothetical protein
MGLLDTGPQSDSLRLLRISHTELTYPIVTSKKVTGSPTKNGAAVQGKDFREERPPVTKKPKVQIPDPAPATDEEERQYLGKSEPYFPTEERKPDLSWLNIEGIDDLPDAELELVIHGLLHIGEKLGITAGCKSFKTWMLLYIGFCVSNGLDFLGFKSTKSKVIVFDLELSRWELKRRLNKIQKTLGMGNFENIKICSLRGKARLFCSNLNATKDRIVADQFKVVIIDPV